MKRMFIVFLLIPLFTFSQTGERAKPRFHSFVSSGIIAGQSLPKPLFQLSGGVSYNRYFTGIGIGYDNYRFNTVPVFADWRVNFGTKDVFFIYANAGYNFPGSYKEEQEGGKVSDRLKGNFYMDAGFGLRAPPGGSHRFFFSAGYSRKNVVLKKEYASNCGLVPCATQQLQLHTYRYELGRIMVKAGWEFGK